MSRRPYGETKDSVLKLWRVGMTCVSIARTLDLHTAYVRKTLYRNGVESTQRKRASRRRP